MHPIAHPEGLFDIVVGDECDDPHLASALRPKQRVYLVDTLDELRPAPAEGTGVGAMISVGLNQGGMLAPGCAPKTPYDATTAAVRSAPR